MTHAGNSANFGGKDAAYYEKQGREAAELGLARNPYKRESWQHASWDDGWYENAAAYHEDEITFGGNDLRRYFTLGASGFRTGLSDFHNPYDPDGWQYKAWLRGWRYAKALHTPPPAYPTDGTFGGTDSSTRAATSRSQHLTRTLRPRISVIPS